MKVMVIYKDNTDHAREVIDYMRDFEAQTGHTLEVIDPDTPDGAQFCRTYDIVEYPSVLATSDDGVLQHLWRGRPLPLINEVSYYV
jgi:hypothetical protein